MFKIKDARRLRLLGILGLILMLGIGVMARNGWFPSTDPLTGQKTGWFGKKLPKNASSSWNPLAQPNPTPTPQLSKEYIYAGSRLLAVEDANASAVWPADIVVWRPMPARSEPTWSVMGGPNSQQTSFFQGQNGDQPVVGDFDGDGKTDFSLYRPLDNTWYINQSSNNTNVTIALGTSGDATAQADYDGDGKTDAAVFRPSNGTWYIKESSSGNTVTKSLGTTGDKVAPADYDGDGRADPAVWRYGTTSQFHVLKSTTNSTSTLNLGSASTDIPVSADYDGDGKADHALLIGNVWTIHYSSSDTTGTVTWQTAGWLPVHNDYDGDGKVDIAVYQPGLNTKGESAVWYIRNSANLSTRTVTWGRINDIPVPAYYRR